MKDCTFELEFTSHVLANGNGQDGMKISFSATQRTTSCSSSRGSLGVYSRYLVGTNQRRKGKRHQVDLTFTAPKRSVESTENTTRQHEAVCLEPG